MPAAADTLILHQYEVSPFSEKVRVALAIKGLAWQACDQPVISPKPEMARLTGGYRRIPVLQIGADVWFDSLYIIEELERRHPTPSAFAGSGVGLASAFARWSDAELFMGAVGLLFGGDWNYDEAFLKDRSELTGRPFDPSQFGAAAPALTLQLRQNLSLLEAQLADGRAFLTGDAPDVVDASVYCQAAFIRWGKGRTAAVLDGFPKLNAWEKRVAALGHGKRGPDVGREEALAIAKAATPAPLSTGGSEGGFTAGERVGFRYLDANSPVLEGTLVRIDLRGLTIKPANTELGDIHLHMPHSVGALEKR
jgi:glutathione S-transferase